MKRTLLLCAVLALTACSGNGGRAEPRQSEGVIPQERVSTDDALPDEFPEDIFLPGNPKVLYSAVGPYGVSVYFRSSVADSALKGALIEGLDDRGWRLAACHVQQNEPEPVTVMTAVKGERVASFVVGYTPENAERIQGADYSYLISVTSTSRAPDTTAEPC